MKTPSSQSERKPADSLKVNFSHRLGVFDDASPIALTDTVDAMTDRARSVLLLLAGQFDGPDNYRFSDEIISGVLASVICDVQDIQSVVSAFFETTRDTPEESPSPKSSE